MMSVWVMRSLNGDACKILYVLVTADIWALLEGLDAAVPAPVIYQILTGMGSATQKPCEYERVPKSRVFL